MTKAKLVFDPFSQEFFNGSYDVYRRMREEAPVYYSEEYDFYALSRHADVSRGLTDFATFSSSRGVDLAQVRTGGIAEHKSIIVMDPPEHRQMRGLLSKVFTPRAISSLEPMVSEQIDRFLGQVDPDGFDLVQDFSVLFPVEVVTRMLGVPAEHRQQVRLWIDELLHREPGQVEMSEAGMQAAIESAMLYYGLAKERRDNPQDDMLSKLVGAEIEREDGEMTGLDNIEIASFATLLGGAGAETVAKLIGNAAVVFAQNPDQWELLLADRSKIPAAVEELLRYEAPAQYNVRYSLQEVHLHGVTIPAGKPVFLLGGSANRDPEAFTDPDVFDIDRDRTEAQNLAFGYGIHSCLGAALARMESAIALDKLLDFMPRYTVDWDGCKRVTMQNVAGWSNVPVRVLR
ncbi:cytochrome P450 [Nocardia sp. 348MFTsu5.1]|uniref:cytochrome P450 n=1 Tax=Nocardia sp. 348MFTsu5.1 TaxID=1172185 RepID=UPI0003753E6C|nr:cytochrome P450 [Nocardia sp. 348MFTsu5.1]